MSGIFSDKKNEDCHIFGEYIKNKNLKQFIKPFRFHLLKLFIKSMFTIKKSNFKRQQNQ
jgi:hypothetical protein